MTRTSSLNIDTYDIVIAGGGPAGLAGAISFARDGWNVVVIEPSSEEALADPAFDGREIALTHHTRHWLEKYGVWDYIPRISICPLEVARIETGQDNQPLLFTPPEEDVRLSEVVEGQNPPALGYLVANHLIKRALYKRARKEENITFLCGHKLASYRPSRDNVLIALENGDTLKGRLLVGADGRFSSLRQKAGIGAVIHDFGMNILVCRMRHPKPHENIALQWFDHKQTIALLPVASDGQEGSISSLVLTLPPEEIARLKALPKHEFNEEITQRTRGRLGALSLESTYVTYPLKAVYAHRFQACRLALIGDAAVGMHPITAHGFNFGIKSQECLAQMIRSSNGDPGAASALRAFENRHRRQTLSFFTATNLIAVTYTRDDLAFRAVRRLGLSIAERFSPFKKAVTKMLMDPTT